MYVPRWPTGSGATSPLWETSSAWIPKLCGLIRAQIKQQLVMWSAAAASNPPSSTRSRLQLLKTKINHLFLLLFWPNKAPVNPHQSQRSAHFVLAEQLHSLKHATSTENSAAGFSRPFLARHFLEGGALGVLNRTLTGAGYCSVVMGTFLCPAAVCQLDAAAQ